MSAGAGPDPRAGDGRTEPNDRLPPGLSAVVARDPAGTAAVIARALGTTPIDTALASDEIRRRVARERFRRLHFRLSTIGRLRKFLEEDHDPQRDADLLRQEAQIRANAAASATHILDGHAVRSLARSVREARHRVADAQRRYQAASDTAAARTSRAIDPSRLRSAAHHAQGAMAAAQRAQEAVGPRPPFDEAAIEHVMECDERLQREQARVDSGLRRAAIFAAVAALLAIVTIVVLGQILLGVVLAIGVGVAFMVDRSRLPNRRDRARSELAAAMGVAGVTDLDGVRRQSAELSRWHDAIEQLSAADAAASQALRAWYDAVGGDADPADVEQIIASGGVLPGRDDRQTSLVAVQEAQEQEAKIMRRWARLWDQAHQQAPDPNDDQAIENALAVNASQIARIREQRHLLDELEAASSRADARARLDRLLADTPEDQLRRQLQTIQQADLTGMSGPIVVAAEQVARDDPLLRVLGTATDLRVGDPILVVVNDRGLLPGSVPVLDWRQAD